MNDERQDRRVPVKAIAALVLVGLLIAFWAANRREVRVSFLAFDATVRIWIALLVSAVVGFVAGFLARSRD